MADHLDIPVDQTSQIRYAFQAFALDGTPLDLTTATDIILTMKYTLADKTPFATLNLAEGSISVVDPPNGIWETTFSTALSEHWPSIPLIYDMYIVYGAARFLACQGSIFINPTVTGV